ncbi:MAG: hypothetical protein FWH47_04415 [Methanomassiliicoccaceae archaeon]|nr:hypothetical protein [Methanomassiliicoccaceae archaeon]
MADAATPLAALAVLALVALSAYFTYRSLKRGGCSYCGRCPGAGDGPGCKGRGKRGRLSP